jgi:hypothetical protein
MGETGAPDSDLAANLRFHRTAGFAVHAVKRQELSVTRTVVDNASDAVRYQCNHNDPGRSQGG